MSNVQGPLVRIEGEIRLRKTIGFGPFKRQQWKSTPFRVSLNPGERVKAAEQVEFIYERVGDNYSVTGKVKGKQCLFATFDDQDEPMRQFLTLLSVAGIELTGMLNTEPKPRSA